MSQWIEKLLREAGDSPSQPYVVKCAYTGAAASKIGGQTITSAFNTGFGNAYQSLADKTRDLKSTLLSNLVLVIVDEYSMMKSDLLYQLDGRLREVKHKLDVPFGGCAVFLFGDALQLCPVRGVYPFQKPMHESYELDYLLCPLWDRFQPVVLRQNHRQGEDKLFADILIRVSRGSHTKEDLDILSRNIKAKSDPSLPTDALYVYSLNADVNEQNELFLSNIDEPEIEINAIVKHSTMKNFKPMIERDGRIKGTPLQNKLKIKIGAEVMLTHNIDTCDGLTNGAFGRVIGIEYNSNKSIKFILVEFKSESVGKEKRKKYPQFAKKYPGKLCTPIGLQESHYNIEGKKQTKSAARATAINFPLKLSFSCTSHKIQGQTIPKPKKVVVELKRATNPGQAFVMLSRAESLDQIIILDDLYADKWKVSKEALEVVEKMESEAINVSNNNEENSTTIISMNIRSLKNLKHLIEDPLISETSLINVQETWHKEESPKITVEGFQSHFNSVSEWRGNGIATFYRNGFSQEISIKHEHFQMTVFENSEIYILNVYYKGLSESTFMKCLSDIKSYMERSNMMSFIIMGDLNVDYNKTNQRLVLWLKSQNLLQLVERPTHEKGGLIDQVWITTDLINRVKVRQKSVFFSDHDMIMISLTS